MANRGYSVLSKKAVECEKTSDYSDASIFWHRAAMVANRDENIEWAAKRRDTCASLDRNGWGHHADN
ncbi:ANR family transcriptional regulator [Limnobaculum xujianqingii]|uniref:ANR family transcriptional regulator n=1 Tax=Limnobaculum xujianqingii TaxID=2738837 RepID=UPI00112A91C2|nr:ANR family transcriptional regulator [Limnobaculum xujianqingii]